MRYLNTYQHYIVNENSKNDAIPEITQGGKLGIVLIGAPGIGKSTFAKNYITHKNQNIKIFSTDEYDYVTIRQKDINNHTFKLDDETYMAYCNPVAKTLDYAPLITRHNYF